MHQSISNWKDKEIAVKDRILGGFQENNSVVNESLFSVASIGTSQGLC